jgi:hypothetical protein
VTLDAGVTLQAHLPLTAPPPDAGDEVAIELDPALAVVLDLASRRPAEVGARPDW